MRKPLLALTYSVILTFSIGASPGTAWSACGESGVFVQVLGSGGPFGQGRASAGYLVWIDGVARVLVDAGGGTFTHFHEADADVSDLGLIAMSHFHPDHAAELPSLLWTQSGTVRVSGPSGNAGFPSVDDFLGDLFGPAGVFRVMNDRITFDAIPVDVSAPVATVVLSDDTLRVRGIGVPHGQVPAVGYRVDVGETSVAFSSDQNGSNSAFTDLVEDVNVLVIHFAASETATGGTAALHAKPSVWGQIATDAKVGTLVLSHLSEADPSHPAFSTQSGSDFDSNLDHLRSRYDGPLVIAEDLICVPVE